MRERPVVIFLAGFVLGLLFLAVLLRQTGALRTIDSSSRTATQPPEVQTQPPRSPAAEPAPLSATPWSSASMEHKLMIPVQGVRAEQLRDNFNDMRGGHSHEALDIMAPRGTPVLAADEGKVIKLFLSKPGGLTVYQFDVSQTYCYYYAHLDRYAPELKEGAMLEKGDVLGYVGSTGDASPEAPHLHFAIFRLGPERHWWQGTAIDPYGFLTGSAAK